DAVAVERGLVHRLAVERVRNRLPYLQLIERWRRRTHGEEVQGGVRWPFVELDAAAGQARDVLLVDAGRVDRARAQGADRRRSACRLNEVDFFELVDARVPVLRELAQRELLFPGEAHELIRPGANRVLVDVDAVIDGLRRDDHRLAP